MGSTILDRIKRAFAPLTMPVFVYDADPPTIEDGDVRPAQMDASGALKVSIVNGGGGVGGDVSQGVAGTDPWLVRAPARVERQVYRASAVLPAAGVFTATAPYAIPDGVRAINFYVTYSWGTEGSQPVFRIMAGNGTELGRTALMGGTVTEVGPNGQRTLLLEEIVGPMPTTGDPVTFVIPWMVQGGETQVQLLAAEMGSPNNPGTCAIALTAQYG